MPSMGPSVLVHDSSCTKSEFDTTLGSVTSPGAPIDTSSSIPTRRNLNRQKTHNLHLLNVNWRSINNRHRQFQNMIDSNNPDIMVITESWLSPNQADGEIAEDGHFSSDYTIHRCDQGYCHMQQSKKYTVHRLRTRRHCHGMGQVRSQQCQITFYHQSARNTDDLWLMMDSVQHLSSQTASHIWLMGNFNLPNIVWCQDTMNTKNNIKRRESHEAFLDMLDAAALTQTVREPTRDENILDPFSTNNETLITGCTLIPGISDHDAVLIESRLRPNTPRPHMEICRLEWHKDPHRNSLVQPTRRGQGWGDSRASLGSAYIHHSGRSNQSLHPTQTPRKAKGTHGYLDPWSVWWKGEEAVLLETTQAHEMQHQQTQEGSTASTEALPARVLETHQWHLIPSRNSGPIEQKKNSVEIHKALQKDSIGVASLRNCKTGELLTEAKNKAEVLNDQFQ